MSRSSYKNVSHATTEREISLIDKSMKLEKPQDSYPKLYVHAWQLYVFKCTVLLLVLVEKNKATKFF